MPDDRVPLLLIEDNPADQRLLVELLEEMAPGRFRVAFARRLSEGIEVLRTGRVAVVLLDLSLPDADGVASIAATRKAAPTTPIVVLSGTLDDEARQSARERGATASFVKGEGSIVPLIAALDEIVQNAAESSGN